MKCPCENCLLIGICKNRSKTKPVNFVHALNQCSLLCKFLKIDKISLPTLQLWSNLDAEELQKRLDKASKFIPFEEQKVKKKGK